MTDSHDAIERDEAVRDVLQRMSRSGFDLDETLHAVIEHAVTLCRADHGDIHRRDGDGFRNVAMFGAAAEDPRYIEIVGRRAGSRSTVGPPSAGMPSTGGWSTSSMSGSTPSTRPPSSSRSVGTGRSSACR